MYETALNRLADEHTAIKKVLSERSEQLLQRLTVLENGGVTPTMLADLFIKMEEQVDVDQ